MNILQYGINELGGSATDESRRSLTGLVFEMFENHDN